LPPAPRKKLLMFASQTPRKWLVTTVAAAAVVVLGTVTTLLLTSGGGAAQESGTPTSTGTEALPPLRVFDGGVVQPWIGFVASDENWGGTEFGEDGASQTPISAKRDGTNGLRVTWTSTAGQVYLQSADPRDLKSYVDNKGALVFDVAVHTPPAKQTKVAVHCQYPCGADVSVTNLLQKLEPDQKTTVKIPLSCFTAGGLDPKKVNTPFLVYTEQPFDATFSNVRWEAGVATDSDATPCAKLH
jgi:molecular chaperone DnaK